MMRHKISTENGKTVVVLGGDIDTQGSDDLTKILNTVMENGCPEVLLDFHGVTYIGTSGINILLNFYIDFAEKGGKMNIVNLHREIGSMFKAIHLDKYFSF